MPKISASTNIDWIQAQEQAGNPATPASGYGRIFIKSDGLYFIDDAGAVVGPLTDSSGASGFFGTVLLDTTVGAGGQANFDVDPIGTGYAYVKIYLFGRSATAATSDNVRIAFNADTTGTNYRRSRITSDGSTVTPSVADDRNIGAIAAASADAGEAGSVEITIFDPDNATFRKQAISTSGQRRSATVQQVETTTMDWENTAAITRITLDLGSTANFVQATRCLIVGYKNH